MYNIFVFYLSDKILYCIVQSNVLYNKLCYNCIVKYALHVVSEYVTLLRSKILLKHNCIL